MANVVDMAYETSRAQCPLPRHCQSHSPMWPSPVMYQFPRCTSECSKVGVPFVYSSSALIVEGQIPARRRLTSGGMTASARIMGNPFVRYHGSLMTLPKTHSFAGSKEILKSEKPFQV